jgi:hypothetical protein
VANPAASATLTTPVATTEELDTYSGPCPKGYRCPLALSGITEAVACDESSEYQDVEGQGECKPCPAGHYCTQTERSRCKPADTGVSFYCPAGDSSQVRCPSGTYSFRDGAFEEDDCHACPPGSYCPDSPESGTQKILPCPAGRYCIGGVAEGTLCPTGFYCPPRSPQPVPCDPGQYCGEEGLSAPSGACDAGYYCAHETVSEADATAEGYDFCYGADTTTVCARGARTADQNVCSAGAYCPAASRTPVECPIGTLLATTGAAERSECGDCPAG